MKKCDQTNRSLAWSVQNMVNTSLYRCPCWCRFVWKSFMDTTRTPLPGHQCRAFLSPGLKLPMARALTAAMSCGIMLRHLC